MGYWKTKVLPKIQKVFGKDATKKAAAIEACKSFEESKEEVSKEFEEKKAELQPKVLEIYEASETEIKILIKDPKEAGLKKHSVKVQKFLDELVKIEFPGSKPVCEASSKFGPALIPGPVSFIFKKVSTFVVTEEKPREIEVTPTQEEPKESGEPSKEIVATEEKPTTEEPPTETETTESKEEPPKEEVEAPPPVVEEPPAKAE